jgi:AhpC/TSA family
LRATVCLLLVVVCLLPAGCSHSGHKDSVPTPSLNPSGGGSALTRPETTRDPNAPPPGADGLLAGQVLDSFGRHPEGVSIQIVDLQDTRQTKAGIEVQPQEKGYFTIQGLQVGRHYQLIARVKDGSKILSGTTLASPPNPRVTIFLSEDNATDNTPALPAPPGLPEKRNPIGTGAVIEAPKRMEPAGGDGENPLHHGPTTPAGGGPIIPAPPGDGKPPSGVVPAATKGDPTKVAGTELAGGVPPKVNIQFVPTGPPAEKRESKEGVLSPAPGKNDQLPPIDVGARATDPVKPPKPADDVRAPAPGGPTPNNSCVLVGKKLEDFSLTDLEGDPWQFKRDHKGQVVLLDFWSSGSDLVHIHRLAALKKTYGAYGLEIVGIAYEGGTPTQQVSNVRSIRGRYTVNYTTILGGAFDACQVKKQFDVTQFPTAILLDGEGKILYRADEMEKVQMQELEKEIRKRLGITDTLPWAGE